MEKSTYYVFSCRTEDGKLYAYADTIQNSENLVSIFARIPGLLTANACDTRRKADEIALCWNRSYRDNGNYAF